MVTAVDTVLFARDADAARAFFADVLELHAVDAGSGWLIFALPPAELAVHPDAAGGRQELYLMTDDLDAALARLRERGVAVARGPSDQGWGIVAAVDVPGYGPLGIYEPRHPVPR